MNDLKKDSYSLLDKWYNLPPASQRQFRKFCFSKYASLSDDDYTYINNIKRVADSRKDPLAYIYQLSSAVTNCIVDKPAHISKSAFIEGIRNRRRAESPVPQELIIYNDYSESETASGSETTSGSEQAQDNVVEAPQEQEPVDLDYNAFEVCIDLYFLLLFSSTIYYIYYINYVYYNSRNPYIIYSPHGGNVYS